MRFDELMTTVHDSVSVRRVFAEPVERDGTSIIAAASVLGGGGGGQGQDQRGEHGEGGGFGTRARPVGAYVIKNGDVRWIPAVDVNRLVFVAGAVLIVYLLVRVRIAKARAKARQRNAEAAGDNQ